METETLQNTEKKEVIMSASLTETQLRELYNLAISCCGKILNSNPSFPISLGMDISPQRMKMAILIAMEQSRYFKSCVSKYL